MSSVEKLDRRLKTIAQMVRQNIRLADVGCDHGYLITALAADGIITGGIACDINEMPLDNARTEIARRNLESVIECRLGSGLDLIGENEVDDIVIAGMGGELIASILEQCRWKNLFGKHFVLQPMSRAPFLRRWLYNNGFVISKERATVSGKHIYTVMDVTYSGKKCNMSEYDLYCYSGELSCDNSREAKLFMMRTLKELKKQCAGAAVSDKEKEQKLLRLIHRLTTVIEEGR